MKVLIIGLGDLGSHVLEEILKSNSVNVEVYTRDSSKYENLGSERISCLKDLRSANQPDLIFITANLYRPEDRFKYLEGVITVEDKLDFRDHEKIKNQEMMADIINGIRHISPVPIIMTANPPELLVKNISESLHWPAVYSMQMMLDNMRIAKITGLPESEYLCAGEHGRPVPTISHLEKVDASVYAKIDDGLLNIILLLQENLGMPAKAEAKQALSELIKSITENTNLRCILTAPDSETKTGFGKPFIVNGLSFTEQKMPELSDKEKAMIQEAIIRLRKKWGENKEIKQEMKLR